MGKTEAEDKEMRARRKAQRGPALAKGSKKMKKEPWLARSQEMPRQLESSGEVGGGGDGTRKGLWSQTGWGAANLLSCPSHLSGDRLGSAMGVKVMAVDW